MGDKRQWCLAQDLVGDNTVSEPAAMSFTFASGGEEIRATPFAYTHDIKASFPDTGPKHVQVMLHRILKYTTHSLGDLL